MHSHCKRYSQAIIWLWQRFLCIFMDFYGCNYATLVLQLSNPFFWTWQPISAVSLQINRWKVKKCWIINVSMAHLEVRLNISHRYHFGASISYTSPWFSTDLFHFDTIFFLFSSCSTWMQTHVCNMCWPDRLAKRCRNGNATTAWIWRHKTCILLVKCRVRQEKYNKCDKMMTANLETERASNWCTEEELYSNGRTEYPEPQMKRENV